MCHDPNSDLASEFRSFVCFATKQRKPNNIREGWSKDIMKASNNYPVPDVFRLCAALLVVMYHPSGQIRKTGFGLISGDIISIGVERASSGTEFFKNRLLRILPCLWLCSWIGAMLFFVFGLFPLPQIIQMYTHSALLLPSGPYVHGVIWTIMFELVFYLLVGSIIVVFGNKNLLYFGMGIVISRVVAIVSVLGLSFLISEYLGTRLRKALQRTFTFAASAARFIAVAAFRAIANARTKGEVLTAVMADETSVAMRENLMLPVGLEPSKLMKRKDA